MSQIKRTFLKLSASDKCLLVIGITGVFAAIAANAARIWQSYWR